MSDNDTRLPDIIAHRGNAIEFPENTLQALESAVALGVRNIEFDVQLTADHVPVVIHDADLARVGNRPESVHSLSWSQLAEIPVGEASRFGERFAGTCAPSLAQAVAAIAGWGDVTAFVEVKRSSLRQFGRENRAAQDERSAAAGARPLRADFIRPRRRQDPAPDDGRAHRMGTGSVRCRQPARGHGTRARVSFSGNLSASPPRRRSCGPVRGTGDVRSA